MAQNLLVSLSGSFQTAPTFLAEPENGVTYNVAVQTPQYRVDSLQALMNTPMNARDAPAPQVLAQPGDGHAAVTPAVVSHYNIQPVMDVYASVQGRDLGGVATRHAKDHCAVSDASCRRAPRSYARPGGDHDSPRSSDWASDLVMAIVLVYLLIVVNFQSWLDPFIIITALARRAGGNRVDAAADAHDAERARR